MNKILTLFGLLLLTFLSACGDKQVGPSEKDLASEFYTYVAGINGGEATKRSFEVSDFKVLISENSGTEVTPIIEGRYQATLVTKKPLYKLKSEIEADFDGVEPLIVILEEVDPKGLKTVVTGTYSSAVDVVTEKKTVWRTYFKMDTPELNRWSGLPIEKWSETHAAYIKGSEAHLELAEKFRIEKKRKEDAKKEYQRKRAVYKKSIEGTWISTTPLTLKETGKPFIYPRNFRKNETHRCWHNVSGGGIRITIPENFNEKSRSLQGRLALAHRDTGKYTREFKWWGGSNDFTSSIKIAENLKSFSFVKRDYVSLSCFISDPQYSNSRKAVVIPGGGLYFKARVEGSRMFAETQKEPIYTMEFVRQ